VKFSHEGGTVTVEVTVSGNGTVRIDVVDQGIGMAPEDVPGAFEVFRQLDSLLERRREGAGLGLPLSRQLVELHGGTIRLETALGKGTRAIVELPGVHVFTRTAGSSRG
jgi:signal transduction histidine kinase